MKNIIASILLVTSMVILSGCSLTWEKEDAMKLEGMMPKEDNKTIDAMMKKTEGEDAKMKEDANGSTIQQAENKWTLPEDNGMMEAK